MGTKKTLEQKIALAQDRLSKLKKAINEKERKAREHAKFSAGGEVTRVMGLDFDQALLVGFLDYFGKLTDEQKDQLKAKGEMLINSRKENAEK